MVSTAWMLPMIPGRTPSTPASEQLGAISGGGGSDDIVLKTGRATYYVEMRTWPPTGILDPAGNLDPVGWGVGRSTWISNLAFHPHEDPGARSWQLEDVKLLRNDYVNPAVGGTDIKFIDDAWAPGTTADIIADPNLNPNDPAQVVIAAGIPVSAGLNTFRWTGWPAAYGSYFPRVVLRRNGLAASSYAFGAIDYGRHRQVVKPAQ